MIIIYQNEVDFDFHLKNKTMSFYKIKQKKVYIIVYRIYPKYFDANNYNYMQDWIFLYTEMV